MWLDLTGLTAVTVFAPLLGSVWVGAMALRVSRFWAYAITITGMLCACVAASGLLYAVLGEGQTLNQLWYTWGAVSDVRFSLGVLIDPLSAIMMWVVCVVSLLVHVYSTGYMHDDTGYARFFSYMSLFTFAMLLLLCANNLLQLFFGWEGVGVVSYLLIGFWFQRDAAVAGSLKAFLVNRVGDVGFLLGMALLFSYTHSLDYRVIFEQLPHLAALHVNLPVYGVMGLPTAVSLLLFIGAMAKSAQMPLHVWLPASMEGPTPISALIHAATMVTAGVFMMARLSPLYVLSPQALSVILIVGASSALLMGLVGIVQQDIKRVIAYSTLSQLGYMVAAVGAGAATAGVFHLLTHAFFKALLFLGAGTVIIALHHEQDLRKMGNLYRYLPVTYVTCLMGTLSLVALPPFAGFYSKEAIIESVKHSHLLGSHYAYYCLLGGAAVTAFYSFRVFFLTFHTTERLAHPDDVREAFPAMTWPLIVLAVPTVVAGILGVGPLLHDTAGWFHGVIATRSHHPAVPGGSGAFSGWFSLAYLSVFQLPFWMTVCGGLAAWLCYVQYPAWPDRIARRLRWCYCLLQCQYGFDCVYHIVFVKGARCVSANLYRFLDHGLIDQWGVEGTAQGVWSLSGLLRALQSGYLYHYAFFMIAGWGGCLALLFYV